MTDHHTNVDTPAGGVLLPGIDGSNPLGFLAALGLLRVLGSRPPAEPVRMAWVTSHVSWSPRVYGAGESLAAVADQVAQNLCCSLVWALDNRLPFSAERLRMVAKAALQHSTTRHRNYVDLLAAFGSECLHGETGLFADTAFRMLRSADSGGNGLLAYARAICAETTPNQLLATLARPWTYSDEGNSLRWDPAEDRGYAHRWRNPSSEKTASERGANRLALEGLALLPTAPVRMRLITAAFGRPTGGREAFTWPIWRPSITLNVVRSLLTLPELQEGQPLGEPLHARGIAAVYRSDRYQPSKYYSNFRPARRIA